MEGRNDVVLGDTVLQSEVLEDMGDAPNYQAWLCAMARPYLGENPVELGSGLGLYASEWLETGVPQFTVTEADDRRLQGLRERFAGDERVTVRTIDSTTPRGSYSSFVSFNVLEHIPDDVAMLALARELVRPGGYVVSFVPAFNFAMSDFDRQIGHVRRYRIGTMTKALVHAGLTPRLVKYVNAPGLAAWYLGMRVLKLSPGDGPFLRLWDNGVVPVVRRVERHVRMPFGQSVFSVASVPR